MAPIEENDFFLSFLRLNLYNFIFTIVIFNMKKKQNELISLIFIFFNYFFILHDIIMFFSSRGHPL